MENCCRFLACVAGAKRGGRMGGRKARKRGKGKVPSTLSPTPSLFPFFPIPYPFRHLLRRLVVFGLVSLFESSGSETESPRIADFRLVSSRRKETSGIDLYTVRWENDEGRFRRFHRFRGLRFYRLVLPLLFSDAKTIATLVNYTCKSFMKLTPRCGVQRF